MKFSYSYKKYKNIKIIRQKLIRYNNNHELIFKSQKGSSELISYDIELDISLKG